MFASRRGSPEMERAQKKITREKGAMRGRKKREKERRTDRGKEQGSERKRKRDDHGN